MKSNIESQNDKEKGSNMWIWFFSFFLLNVVLRIFFTRKSEEKGRKWKKVEMNRWLYLYDFE